MKNLPPASTSSRKTNFYSKRQRCNINSNIDERISKISIRVASTMIFVMAASNAIRKSNGFGGPSVVQRPTPCLYLSRTRKKSPSDSYDDASNDNNTKGDIQELFPILPNDNSPKNQPRSTSDNSRKNRRNTVNVKKESGTPTSSLLPPPVNKKSKDPTNDPAKNRATDNKMSQGLTSWEDFLGTSSSVGRREKTYDGKNDKATSIRPTNKKNHDKGRLTSSSNDASSNDELPSIDDLFPSNFSTSTSNLGGVGREPSMSDTSDTMHPSPAPSLEGVLPVSDLFYRSSQSLLDKSQNDDYEKEDQSQQRDDEELPFSAEQSNELSTPRNKIKIRRNKAKSKAFAPSLNKKGNNPGVRTSNPTTRTKKKRLQRRGMEMLVGGVPINADPPQKYIELTYQHDKSVKWDDVISTNSRDFGPMRYGPSVGKLSEKEKGLYCEFFVNSTLKWDVCPKDLRNILWENGDVLFDEGKFENSDVAEMDGLKPSEIKGDLSSNSTEKEMKEVLRSRMVGSMKEAFRKASNIADENSKLFNVNSNAELNGELVFSIGISKEELESSGDTQSAKTILQRVLGTGISTSSQCQGFDIAFSKLQLSDLGDGTTTISAAFVITIENHESMNFAEVKKRCNRINSSLAQAMDDGDMQLAMAAAAKNEKAWSRDFRNRIVEEFLFDDDDGDGPIDGDSPKSEPDLESTIDSLLSDLNYQVQEFKFKRDEADVPFGMPGSPVYSKDDIFLGGGNDGVFWNYAADNAAQAPYQGRLGLRIVDAVTEKAKQRHPRVIAIGDVHGCIDELQDLLRQCDYRPGDMVVFLGDLVSKGPDSFSVVQMAREIGAIGVRGNHDFEVVRWHQAIKSGVDPPVVGSEHYHIANCLTKADMKWMYSLPWYISSPDLGALFVHAGFVSGIRLAKQNPRLMMNMRSILPDGTVTSKFFNNWPWARLWDGPQTVLFGHDADRGLQQYEHAIGLDTGCVYGGRLTACILPEKRLVSVNARREYFTYRRKRY